MGNARSCFGSLPSYPVRHDVSRTCSALMSVHWSSLQISEEDTPWTDEQQITFLYPTFPSTIKSKGTEGLVGGWHGPVERLGKEAAGKM